MAVGRWCSRTSLPVLTPPKTEMLTRRRAHLDTPTGPERGLSSPQQRRTAGGLQALTGTVGRPRVAAGGKVRAPVAVPRCDRLAWERRSPTRPVGAAP